MEQRAACAQVARDVDVHADMQRSKAKDILRVKAPRRQQVRAARLAQPAFATLIESVGRTRGDAGAREWQPGGDDKTAEKAMRRRDRRVRTDNAMVMRMAIRCDAAVASHAHEDGDRGNTMRVAKSARVRSAVQHAARYYEARRTMFESSRRAALRCK